MNNSEQINRVCRLEDPAHSLDDGFNTSAMVRHISISYCALFRLTRLILTRTLRILRSILPNFLPYIINIFFFPAKRGMDSA